MNTLDYQIKFNIITAELKEIIAAMEDLRQQRFNYQIDPTQAIGDKDLDQLALEQGKALVEFPIKNEDDVKDFAEAILNLYHKISGCKKYVVDFISEIKSLALAHGRNIPEEDKVFIENELERLVDEIFDPAQTYTRVLDKLDKKVTPRMLQVLNNNEQRVLTNIKRQYENHLNKLKKEFQQAQQMGNVLVASKTMNLVLEEALALLAVL